MALYAIRDETSVDYDELKTLARNFSLAHR